MLVCSFISSEEHIIASLLASYLDSSALLFVLQRLFSLSELATNLSKTSTGIDSKISPNLDQDNTKALRSKRMFKYQLS